MVGPDPDAQGGMASVASVYRANGLFSVGDFCYIITACEGGRLRKFQVACTALAQFTAMLAGGRVRVLHVQGASFGSFWRKRLFMQLAKRFGVPVIFHLHGGEFRRFVDERVGSLQRGKIIDSLNACSLIYCLSNDVAAWLRRVVPAVSVEVLPNPVELIEVGDRVGCRDRSVLFLGRVEKEKGVFDLLEAFSRIAVEEADAHLSICGIGSAREELRRLVGSSGLSGRVSFPGWVTGEDKFRLLATAGVFVLPSYAEGMPMAVLEAMALGAPVVASRVGAIAEMLDGDCGRLIEPGNVEQLAQSIRDALTSERTATMSRRAAARVQKHYAADVVLQRIRSRHNELSQ